ncbi:recombinase, partial [Nitratireductor indicus C115]
PVNPARFKTLGAKTKENGEKRDRLEIELSRLPPASNIVLHPTAIAAFAQRLMQKSSNPHRSNRAKLEVALGLMDDMGELGPVLRELIHSITVHEEGGHIRIDVKGHLTPFLRKDGNPLKDTDAVAMVAEEGLEPPTQGL